jgi:formate hydrogenlyase transcriptional activator
VPTVDRYQLICRLSRACADAGDVRDLFHQATRVFHEACECQAARLLVLSSEQEPAAAFAWERTDGVVTALPPAQVMTTGVRWAIEHREARRLGCDEGSDDAASAAAPPSLSLPLLCRAETVGVLELLWQDKAPAGRCDRALAGELASALAVGVSERLARDRAASLARFQHEAAFLRGEAKHERDLRLLTGESAAMKAVRLAIGQVARTDSTVLILGETGTGKELVARAIHQQSRRRDHLLVPVNCAALASGVIASELFGHEQGAFTGATRRRAGRFELAHQGTIFLDEIGELPAETQVMLLRVLQERVIERVGGQSAIPVDVRTIAATHQDLAIAIEQGRFRADLSYRLNVFPIRLPPLRERREDIPDLLRYFLHHLGRRLNKAVTRVSPAALDRLVAYHWPGNVRELENVVERAMIVAEGDVLEIDPLWFAASQPRSDNSFAGVERQAILDALARAKGRIYGAAGAAALLSLKPTTLYGKMRRLGIQRPRD